MIERAQRPPALRKIAHVHAHQGGRVEPRLDVTAPKCTPGEQLQAAVESLVRDVRLATPKAERCLVMVEELGDVRARAYLELDQGTEEEAARGMLLLRTTAA